MNGRFKRPEDSSCPRQQPDGSFWCPFNFFRTSKDIDASDQSWIRNLQTVVKFLDASSPLAGRGCWAYPDMIETGNLRPPALTWERVGENDDVELVRDAPSGVLNAGLVRHRPRKGIGERQAQYRASVPLLDGADSRAKNSHEAQSQVPLARRARPVGLRHNQHKTANEERGCERGDDLGVLGWHRKRHQARARRRATHARKQEPRVVVGPLSWLDY